MLANFSNSLLSREQMKKVNGGQLPDDWWHSWGCWCGMTYYEGQGNLNDYRNQASQNCAGGSPITCHFDQPGGW